jgi:hypothetical protein
MSTRRPVFQVDTLEAYPTEVSKPFLKQILEFYLTLGDQVITTYQLTERHRTSRILWHTIKLPLVVWKEGSEWQPTCLEHFTYISKVVLSDARDRFLLFFGPPTPRHSRLCPESAKPEMGETQICKFHRTVLSHTPICISRRPMLPCCLNLPRFSLYIWLLETRKKDWFW